MTEQAVLMEAPLDTSREGTAVEVAEARGRDETGIDVGAPSVLMLSRRLAVD